ncbi:signal recognition particle protein Srp54 [Ignicoccus hospitalis]|uniref:Signal recognition particle 54 kDa protein n=1 Tax=Ignicoccus hospitalis (strain KIN4/I / DSM 18386 / JCM 14125) TaxID=453591 RepID=A8ABC0_IGNH4|nr:signal recognition particle subunit FFH/SRP54 (srp54) [Ignicoccus hospitalis KIN4/I]HIH90159.1 signal recognition particle protein [Desulfurococcaceae archaeon]
MLDGVREAVKKFLRSSADYETSVNLFIKELQKTLIKSDVNVKLVLQLTKRIRERALKERPPPGASRRDWFVKIVYEELANLFGGDKEPELKPPKVPWVIMMVGVQGSGKTTTAGKLARFYKVRGYRVALVAADTYRPGAKDQLRQLAERAKVLFYTEPGDDAVGIAKRGVEWAKSQGAEIIIVDTAGRHKNEAELLKEMKEMSEAIKPDEVMLVIDASIGQQAKALAEAFHKTTPIGSIVVTKLDGTAKGGGALSAVAVTGATIKFVGTGEKLEELEPFKPKKFVARILGLGDLEGLLERLKGLEEADKLEEISQKVLEKGDITLKDLYYQIVSVKKMGSLKKLLQMLPGVGLALNDKVLGQVDDKVLDKWLAILNSMTLEELEKPNIIDRSRMRRIAIGSGTSVKDVEELLKHYQMTRKMIRQLKRKRGMLNKLMEKFELQ